MKKIRETLFAIVLFCLIAGCLSGVSDMTVFAAKITPKEVVLADFGKGCIPDDVVVKNRRDDTNTTSKIDTSTGYEGSSSLAYTFNNVEAHIIMPYNSRLYDKYDVLKVRVYTKIPNQKINFIVNEKETASSSSDKGCYVEVIETTGEWQVCSIPVASLKKKWETTPENLYVLLSCSAWNIYPGTKEQLGQTFLKSGKTYTYASIKGETFHIDKIWLDKSPYEITDAISDSAVVYAGSTNAYNRLSATTLETPVEYENNKLFAPLSLFETLFDMTNDGNRISGKNIVAEFEPGKAYAQIGAYTHELSERAYESNCETYVALSDLCEIFKIPLMTDGRFAVMGSEKNIEYINRYDEYGVNIVNEHIMSLLDEVSSSVPDTEGCNAVIDNWVKSIAGDELINDISNKYIKSHIDSVTSSAENARKLLIKQDGSAELFSDQTSTATSHMSTTAKRIYNMARAYATFGSGLYMDDSLLEDVLYSLEWFYENRYGEDEINGNGWHSTKGFNWHDWQVTTPSNIISAMMLVKKHLTDEQISDYLRCFHHVSPSVEGSTGANYMSACRLIIGAAALEDDAEKVKKYKTLAEEAFLYVDNERYRESHLDAERAEYTTDKGLGFYKDGSYIFHTLHAMNGSYGISHLEQAANLIDLFDGTAFEISKTCVDNMADWILNSFDSAIYGNRMMRMMLGRTENPDELTASQSVVSAILSCFNKFDEADREKLGSVIRYYASFNEGLYRASISPEHASLFDEIINNTGYYNYRYDYANVFGNIDKVMHRRRTWGIGISMSSSRIFNYESINGQNLNGWYLGDGRYELILEDEASEGADTYWSGVDYYRLPGTTVDTQKRQEVSISQGKEYLSSKDFVGGVELDGKYSTAAMHLESYHNEKQSDLADNGYGGPAPVHTSDLTAKKSYFMFDREIVCLGTEINASDNNNAEVLTVVENRIVDCYGSTKLKIIEDGKNRETENFDIKEFGATSKWLNVSTIKIPVYSSVANGEVLNIVICKSKSGTSDGYHIAKVTIDWTGWKVIELKKRDFTSSKNFNSWSDINSIYFNVGGWSNPKPQASTELYISRVTACDTQGRIVVQIPFDTRKVAQKAEAEFSVDMKYQDTPQTEYFMTDAGEAEYFADDTKANNITWFNQDENIGYWFPHGYREGELEYRLTDGGYFEAILNHGVNPEDASYSYVMLPSMTSEETEEYSQNPSVEILANNGDVQAVRYINENITSIVFWNAGSFEGITVSKPMMVMLKDDGENLRVSLSDPTHKLNEATVTFDRPLHMSSSGVGITQEGNETETVINVDFTGSLGSSLEAVFKAGEPVLISAEFTDSDGNILNRYAAHGESTVNIRIQVSNLGFELYDASVFAAEYDKNGNLENVQVLNINDIASGCVEETGFTVTPRHTTARIEVFVWSKNTLRPCSTLYRNL